MTNGDLVLGITTSGPVGVAVLSNHRAAALAGDGQALESLLKTVERVLKLYGCAIDDVKLIAVDVGPGSFTGLRIGVAFAKSLTQANGIGIVGVSAYDIAEDGEDRAYPQVAVVAGKRDYYYVRVRRAPDSEPTFAHGETTAMHNVLADARPNKEADPSALVFRGSPAERARVVARLGRQLMRRGEAADWRSISIDYGQRPNAVANWEARRAQGGTPGDAAKQHRA